jgi:predicted PurR-regulated permease PerM
MIDPRLFFTVFLICGFMSLFYFLFGLFAPFFTSLCWAAMIVLVFGKAYRRVLKETGNRETLAAFLMCFFLSLFVVLPTIIVGTLLFQEVLNNSNLLTEAAENLNFDRLLEKPFVARSLGFLGKYVNLDTLNLKGQLIKAAQQTSQFFLGMSAGFFLMLSNFLITLTLIVLNMFFFFRDGHRYLAYIESLLPLTPDAKLTLNRRISEVIQTSILGSFATAAANGFLGGLIFAILGLPSPVLWGVMMAILAFIPLVGPVVIWGAAAVWLFTQGQILSASILVIWGLVAMMGFADNLVRPLLMRRMGSDETQMNTLVLFLSVIGGLQVYGLLGIVLGPLIVVVALTVFEMYRLYYRLPEPRHEPVLQQLAAEMAAPAEVPASDSLTSLPVAEVPQSGLFPRGQSPPERPLF